MSGVEMDSRSAEVWKAKLSMQQREEDAEPGSWSKNAYLLYTTQDREAKSSDDAPS